MSNFYFIDFENLQNLDYASINKDTDQIVIFVGKNQAKINLDVIKKTQPLGKAVEWIQMEGSGRNSLDFHIAFYLGYFIALQESLSKKTKVHVISKDGDYDTLIKHIQSLGYECERKQALAYSSQMDLQPSTLHSTNSTQQKIETIPEINSIPDIKKSPTPFDNLTLKLNSLSCLEKPKTQKELLSYISNHYREINIAINAPIILEQLSKAKTFVLTKEAITQLPPLTTESAKKTKSATSPEISATQNKITPTLDAYNLFLEKLKKLERPKRPRKQDTLSNYITSFYRGIKSPVNPNEILNRLKKQKIITLTGEKVTYLA